MRSLNPLIHVLVNLTGLGYAVALSGLLLLHFLGRDHRWWIAFLINFLPFYFFPLFIFILAALLTHARLALIVTLPLGLLGLVTYGPLFLPKATEGVSGTALTLITFNVSDKNQQQASVLAWLRQQQADIILLQEVATSWFEPLQQELLDRFPYQDQQLTERGYRGNLVFSRFPLMPNSTPPNTMLPVRTLHLDIEGYPVTVFNVSLATPVNAIAHRDLPFDYPLLDLALSYNDALRNYQIKGLRALIASETGPYIVTGDFNMSDQTSIYATLAAQMGDSFREAGLGLGATWPAFQVVGLDAALPALLRIDYIWHSDAFRALHAAVGPYLGSDHLPVEATLNFTADRDW